MKLIQEKNLFLDKEGKVFLKQFIIRKKKEYLMRLKIQVLIRLLSLKMF